MNRIKEKLLSLQKKDKKANIKYLTAGFPKLSETKRQIDSLDKTEMNMDMIVLGIPFSDPVADGPVIQKEFYHSICSGTSVEKIFSLVSEVRKQGVEIPILFKLYYNSVIFMGIENFVLKCARAGVDGLIIPDLPLEEQEELNNVLSDQQTTILIQILSPASGERIPKIIKKARGFILYLDEDDGSTMKVLEQIKENSDIPVALESDLVME